PRNGRFCPLTRPLYPHRIPINWRHRSATCPDPYASHVTESCLMTDHDLRPALAILLLALTCQASDCPQFRGPHRDNLSKDTGLLKSWHRAGPPLAWKAQGLGSGYSSLSVAGDRIYTLGNKGKMSHVIALKRDSGKVIWSVEIGQAGGNLGCTPTVDDGHV